MTPPDRPIRIALQIEPQHGDYADMARAVVAAEELGVDIVFTWDHFYPLYGEPDGKHFECWTLLAAWASITSRVELGPLVTGNTYRNPDLVADMARTVDHVSAGRLILGMGAGWFERDYDEYGYVFESAGKRIDALGASLLRIKARFPKLNPPPTRPIPILIGGEGERKTLRQVALHADIWHSFADPEAIVHKSAVLAEHCAAVGRDPSEIERSVGVTVGPDARGEALLAAGVTLFTIGANGPGYDLGPLQEWLDWRADQEARP